MKHAKKILKPFAYTPSIATSVARTIAKEKKRLADQRASVVTPIRKPGP